MENQSPPTPQTSGTHMPEVSDITYPVSQKWIFKSTWKSIMGFLLVLLIGIVNFSFNQKAYFFLVVAFIYLLFFISFVPLRIFLNWLVKKNFHYKFDTQYLIIHQGILSKEQRNIPYQVIQNVLVNQDLFDKIFGLYTLSIENASMGGSSGEQIKMTVFRFSSNNRKQIGFSGNAVYIPGLKNEHAQFIKNYVLDLMKANTSQRTGGL